MWAALTALFIVFLAVTLASVIWVAANLISYLQPILIPVAIAAILAYLLDPVVTRMCRGGLGRTSAIALLFLVAGFALLCLFWWLVPTISIQSASFARELPSYTQKARDNVVDLLVRYNRTFGTATGRNAQAKSLFNAHAGMRSFMLFPQDTIAIYVDWKCQEVAIAAARSGDEQLMHDYGGDIYHALALMCGLTTDTDIKRWKASEIGKIQRQQMKSLQLGVNYGMGVRSLAKGLDRHRLIASEVITLHQRRYPRYWQFKKETAQQAMFDRVMESEYDGWPMHLSTSPNKRTLYNFPMQSGGASMLRLAATRMCEAGLIPNMLVHDGILIEVQTPEQVEEVVEIMRAAGKEVCNGFEVGADVDFDSREKGQRFMDKRPEAVAMWATIMDVLKEIGALPKKGRL
jgi:hypothetical protein